MRSGNKSVCAMQTTSETFLAMVCLTSAAHNKLRLTANSLPAGRSGAVPAVLSSHNSVNFCGDLAVPIFAVQFIEFLEGFTLACVCVFVAPVCAQFVFAFPQISG